MTLVTATCQRCGRQHRVNADLHGEPLYPLCLDCEFEAGQYAAQPRPENVRTKQTKLFTGQRSCLPGQLDLFEEGERP